MLPVRTDLRYRSIQLIFHFAKLQIVCNNRKCLHHIFLTLFEGLNLPVQDFCKCFVLLIELQLFTHFLLNSLFSSIPLCKQRLYLCSIKYHMSCMLYLDLIQGICCQMFRRLLDITNSRRILKLMDHRI